MIVKSLSPGVRFFSEYFLPVSNSLETGSYAFGRCAGQQGCRVFKRLALELWASPIYAHCVEELIVYVFFLEILCGLL